MEWAVCFLFGMSIRFRRTIRRASYHARPRVSALIGTLRTAMAWIYFCGFMQNIRIHSVGCLSRRARSFAHCSQRRRSHSPCRRRRIGWGGTLGRDRRARRHDAHRAEPLGVLEQREVRTHAHWFGARQAAQRPRPAVLGGGDQRTERGRGEQRATNRRVAGAEIQREGREREKSSNTFV